MLDSIVTLVLVGLGIFTPVNPNVKGITTTPTPTVYEQEAEPTDKETASEVKNKIKLEEKTKSASREAMLKNQEKVKEELKNRRESFIEEMKAKRTEAIEKYKADREKFKTRLQNIKNEKKKEIVSRMDSRLSEMNTKRTTLMSEHIKKLDEIAEKLVIAIEKAKSQGKNTSVAVSKLATAQTAITAAKTAVTAQAQKEYILSITTETNLKTDVGRILAQLESDLKATQKTVTDARNAVMSVVHELVTLGVNPNTGEIKEAIITPSKKDNKPLPTKRLTPTLVPTGSTASPTAEVSTE